MTYVNKFLGNRQSERQFGYLYVDHRNSPGLPEDIARQVGYIPELVREGQVMELPTLGCVHCGIHFVVNPWRERERSRCYKCGNAYICDPCAAAMKAGCEHRTINEICDLVYTGYWNLSGSMTRPILTPAPTRGT